MRQRESGVLYVRQGNEVFPFLIGGHQERGRRGGTENTPSIIGLGRACELAAHKMEKENTGVKRLRDKLEAGIRLRIPNTKINGDLANRLPNTTNISFEFVEGEAIFADDGVKWASARASGSACTSGSLSALSCAACHGGALHHGPWFHTIQPECLQYRGRNRFRRSY